MKKMQDKQPVSSSVWNSRIAIFPKEPDIKSFLSLPYKEYEARARRYAEKGVNLVNATMNFHYRFDWIEFFDEIKEITKRISTACHNHGIKVFEHHSANFISKHKDETYFGWNPSKSIVVDIRTGKPSRFSSCTEDRAVCINNPDFKENFRRYILDFIEKTAVDGLMHDDIHFGGQYHCGCDYCRKKFKSLFGYELPEFGKFPLNDCSNPIWRDWLRFRMISSSSQLQELKKILPDDFLLFSCMGVGVLGEGDIHHAGASMETSAESTDCVFSEGGNLYNKNRAPWRPRNFFANWEKLYVEKKYIKAISSSFSKPAFDMHYPAEPKEGFFCWALAKIFGNCLWRCDSSLYCAGPHNYSDEFEEWEKEYDYFNWERQNEKLFGASRNLNEIGLVFSLNTKLALGVNSQHHGDCFAGWIQTLQECGYQADCILDRDIEDYNKLSSLKLLILPNAAALSKNAVASIKQYVNRGGKLIATHKTSVMDETGKHTGDFQLKDLFGCSFLEERSEQNHWFIENRFSAEPLFSGNAPIFKTFPSIKISWSGETAERHAIAWSERTTTFHEEPQFPAMIRFRYGKGEVIYTTSKPGFHSCREGLFGIWHLNHRRQKHQKTSDEKDRIIHEWIEEPSRNPAKWLFINNSDQNYRLLIKNLTAYMLPDASLKIIKPQEILFNVFERTDKTGEKENNKSELIIGLLNIGGAIFSNMEEVSPPAYIQYPPIEGELKIITKKSIKINEAAFYSPDVDNPVILEKSSSESHTILRLDCSFIKRAGFIILSKAEA